MLSSSANSRNARISKIRKKAHYYRCIHSKMAYFDDKIVLVGTCSGIMANGKISQCHRSFVGGGRCFQHITS